MTKQEIQKLEHEFIEHFKSGWPDFIKNVNIGKSNLSADHFAWWNDMELKLAKIIKATK